MLLKLCLRLGCNNLYKTGSCINVALKSEDEIRAEENSAALTLNLSQLISSKQFTALIKRGRCSVTQEETSGCQRPSRWVSTHREELNYSCPIKKLLFSPNMLRPNPPLPHQVSREVSFHFRIANFIRKQRLFCIFQVENSCPTC